MKTPVATVARHTHGLPSAYFSFTVLLSSVSSQSLFLAVLSVSFLLLSVLISFRLTFCNVLQICKNIYRRIDPCFQGNICPINHNEPDDTMIAIILKCQMILKVKWEQRLSNGFILSGKFSVFYSLCYTCSGN